MRVLSRPRALFSPDRTHSTERTLRISAKRAPEPAFGSPRPYARLVTTKLRNQIATATGTFRNRCTRFKPPHLRVRHSRKLCNLWFFAFLAPVWEKSPIFAQQVLLRGLQVPIQPEAPVRRP